MYDILHGDGCIRRAARCGQCVSERDMAEHKMHAVTGAFGYSGRYIAQRLLDKGCKVITLTNSVHRENPFGGRVQAYPFHFDDPENLSESLKGVSVLYNNYWVRFNDKDFTYAQAVRNTESMFHAAREAGVKRIVHISITNPSEDSPFEYFRGKARLAGDVLITREEIDGLMADLLYVNAAPAGQTRLTDWASEHADSLGRRYTSELARRKDRESAYRSN